MALAGSHGFILDAAVLQRYGVRHRSGEKGMLSQCLAAQDPFALLYHTLQSEYLTRWGCAAARAKSKGKGMAVEEPAAGAEAAERAAGDDARRVTEFFGHAEEEDVDVSAWW